MTWVPSADGARLLGHMILQKGFREGLVHAASASAAAGSTSIGLRVIGGKLLPGNRIGAVIEKVKKGSVADIVAKLLPGMH